MANTKAQNQSNSNEEEQKTAVGRNEAPPVEEQPLGDVSEFYAQGREEGYLGDAEDGRGKNDAPWAQEPERQEEE